MPSRPPEGHAEAAEGPSAASFPFKLMELSGPGSLACLAPLKEGRLRAPSGIPHARVCTWMVPMKGITVEAHEGRTP